MKKLLPLLNALLLAPLVGLSADPVTNGTFNVREYGAAADGKTMDTAAIQKAIDAASSAGGGTVVFPPGTYLSGSIRLLNNVTLRVEKDATLLGSPVRKDYPKGRGSALIVAEGQTNICISGKGVIDGNGKLVAEDTYKLAGEDPKTGKGDGRPMVINMRQCKKVTIRDVTIRDSAFWVQDYRECEDLLIENIIVRSHVAKNNDGIDITDCKRVVVRGCDIDSEDDGICPKSSSSFGCEDMLIENCRVRSSCNGLKFGTASVGGFKKVTVRNLEIYETYQSAIAIENVDGGAIENINISNIRITGANNSLFIRLGNRNHPGAPGTVSNITISNVTAEVPMRPAGKSDRTDFWGHFRQGPLTGLIVGLPGHPIRDVKLRDISITYGGIGDSPQPKADAPKFLQKQVLLKDLSQVPQQTQAYPEAFRFGIVPAWGLYIRHAEGIELDNVTIQVKAGGSDYRAALVCDDVKKLSLNRFNALSAGTEPIIALHDVQGAIIRDSVAPPKAVRFIEKMGNTTDVKTP